MDLLQERLFARVDALGLTEQMASRMQSMRAFLNRGDGVFTVGSACSGSDLCWPILRRIFAKAAGDMPMRHIFSCECNKVKQAWIARNWNPDHIFQDISELASDAAHCIKTGRRERVVGTTLFLAGFSCRSVSRLNSSRKRFASCIRDQSGSTGTTFSGLPTPTRAHYSILSV